MKRILLLGVLLLAGALPSRTQSEKGTLLIDVSDPKVVIDKNI
jgi:hypothetical protein